MAMNVYGSIESPPSGTPSNGHVNGGVSNKPESAATTAPLVSEDKSARQTRRRSHMKLGVAAAAVALVAGAALLATTNQGGQPVDLLSELPHGSQSTAAAEDAPTVTATATEAASSFKVSISNKYTERNGQVNSYPWLDGAHIVEPFMETTFATVWDDEGNAPASTLSASSFDWAIVRRPEEQGEFELDLASSGAATTTINGTGSVFVHTFNELGYHHLELSQEGAGVTTHGLWVRYVRREIRSVDDDDREALLAAFHVLINTTDDAGIALYGSNFKSYQRLSTEHNNFAADFECDRLHDGMGFVPGHFSVGRLMEASLQSVTPGVALPYWEYTIDVEDIIANHNGNFFHWRNIPALSNRWFGATDEATGLIHNESIFSAINQSDNAYATWKNSYQLTRSPWNNYNSPSLVRFIGGGSALGEAPVITIDETQMSTCSVLNWTLALSTSLKEFNILSEKQVHGPIHTYTGGWSNAPNFVSELAAIGLNALDEEVHDSLWGAWETNRTVSFLFAQTRTLWRYGYLSCPLSCSMDTPVADCQCTCNATEVWNDYTVRQGLLKSPIAMFGNESAFGLLELLCNQNILLGDHATSASGADPSFWALHGTVERYLQVLRLQGGFSESWTDDEALFSSNQDPSSARCRGHYANDTLLFGELDGFNLTNWQYYAMTDPTQSTTPYVYDNFHFNHCEKLGYDIGGTRRGGSR